MKKSLLLTLLACCNILLMHAEASQNIGVQAGFAQSIMRLNAPNAGFEKTLNPTNYDGFKVGIVYDATLIKGFGYTIALNYTFGENHTDWEKKSGTQPGDYPKSRTRQLYHQLELPVDWQYKFQIAQSTWFILYTGPTLQYGVSFNKNTQQQTVPNGEITTTQYDRYKDFKHLNVTWGIGAGLQFDRYFLRGGYDFGLINPYKADKFIVSDDYQPYTRGRFDQWQIKLGAYLWKF